MNWQELLVGAIVWEVLRGFIVKAWHNSKNRIK